MEDATMEQVNKFAHMTIDQLLSAYAIAYKADQIETFKEYRKEILDRIRIVGEAKRKLQSVEL